MSIDHLDRAIAILGTQDVFAAALKIKSPSVSEWRKRGRVPVDRCAAIEKITEGAVTRADLRPDIWGVAVPNKKNPAAGAGRSVKRAA